VLSTPLGHMVISRTMREVVPGPHWPGAYFWAPLALSYAVLLVMIVIVHRHGHRHRHWQREGCAGCYHQPAAA